MQNNIYTVTKMGKDRIGIEVILFGLYTAIIPLNQIMNFLGTGTVNRYLGIIVIAAMLINLLQKKRTIFVKREYITLYFFITLIVASYFWSINQEVTIRATVSFISLAVFFIVCSSKIYSNAEKLFIRLCSILGGIGISFFLISTRGLYYSRVFISTSTGQFADPNGLATSIAFSVLFLLDGMLRTKKREGFFIGIFALVVMLYGMLLTGSRGGILGLFVGTCSLISLGLRSKRISGFKVFFLLLICSIPLLIYGISQLTRYVGIDVLERLTVTSVLETGGTGRFVIWKDSVDAFWKRPVEGYGFNAGPNALHRYFGTYVGTHNDLFFLLLGTGVFGLILFGFFFYGIITRSLANKDILSLSMIIMLISIGLSLDYIMNKNFWNVLIYSEIGIGIIGYANNPSRTKTEKFAGDKGKYINTEEQ